MRKLLIITLAVLLIAGCEGDTGPAGPAGLAGQDGNANVQVGTIAPLDADWARYSQFSFSPRPGSMTSYTTRYVDISLGQLTADFIASGIVLVYMEPAPTSGRWDLLPFTFLNFGGTYYSNFVYEVMEGMIRIHSFNTTNDAGTPALYIGDVEFPPYQFKYILIEGVELEEMTGDGVDILNPGQVLEYAHTR